LDLAAAVAAVKLACSLPAFCVETQAADAALDTAEHCLATTLALPPELPMASDTAVAVV